MKEISKYKSDFVGAQGGRGGTKPTGKYEHTFFYGKGNENHELGSALFCTQENHKSSKDGSLY
jgi:hypothetical protein